MTFDGVEQTFSLVNKICRPGHLNPTVLRYTVFGTRSPGCYFTVVATVAMMANNLLISLTLLSSQFYLYNVKSKQKLSHYILDIEKF